MYSSLSRVTAEPCGIFAFRLVIPVSVCRAGDDGLVLGLVCPCAALMLGCGFQVGLWFSGWGADLHFFNLFFAVSCFLSSCFCLGDSCCEVAVFLINFLIF